MGYEGIATVMAPNLYIEDNDENSMETFHIIQYLIKILYLFFNIFNDS